jgi:Putative zinc-finger
MNCAQAKHNLAGYLDGAISSSAHARVRAHLIECRECFGELENYRRLSVCLASVTPAPAPSDLALRIRLQAAHVQSRVGVFQRIWTRAVLTFENILRPIAVPATGGVLTALVAFVLIVQNILVGVPMGGIVPNDLALNLVQPARLESLAAFQVPGIDTSSIGNSGVLTVEATLNAEGQVVSYTILAGPDDSAIHHQLDQVMMFSRFSPEMSFGYPQSGGRVLISFSEVRVHG